jgi:hypothetical protein
VTWILVSSRNGRSWHECDVRGAPANVRSWESNGLNADVAFRISGAHTGGAAENIAAGTKTWAETFRSWQKSPGHNANLLQARADSVGVAVARNDQTRYKTYWAMVIADKSPKKKDRKVAAQEKNVERHESSVNSENPLTTVKNFVCKYLC